MREESINNFKMIPNVFFQNFWRSFKICLAKKISKSKFLTIYYGMFTKHILKTKNDSFSL
jgi:hypothetical protein